MRSLYIAYYIILRALYHIYHVCTTTYVHMSTTASYTYGIPSRPNAPRASVRVFSRRPYGQGSQRHLHVRRACLACLPPYTYSRLLCVGAKFCKWNYRPKSQYEVISSTYLEAKACTSYVRTAMESLVVRAS